MKLLHRTGRKRYGKQVVWFGMFQCDHCGKKVEQFLGNGKTAKSCGCRRGRRGSGKDNKYGKLACCKLFYDVVCMKMEAKTFGDYVRCACYAVEIWETYETTQRARIRLINRLYKRAA